MKRTAIVIAFVLALCLTASAHAQFIDGNPTFIMSSRVLLTNVDTQVSQFQDPIENEAHGSRAIINYLPQPVVGGLHSLNCGTKCGTVPPSFMETFTYMFMDSVGQPAQYFPNANSGCTTGHYYQLVAHWSAFNTATNSYPLDGQIFNCVGNFVGMFHQDWQYITINNVQYLASLGNPTDLFQDSNSNINEYSKPGQPE